MKTFTQVARYAVLVFLMQAFMLTAQTFGPNSPTAGVNTTGIGTIAWSNPGNVLTSDNTFASVTAKGTTNYLAASGFGFNVPVATNIDGIQVEIEKATLSPTVVTVLNNATAGLSKTISAGGSRCLVFVISNENGQGARDITSVTYGTRALTSLTTAVVGTAGGFQGSVEVWYLLESGIALASNTNFVVTFGAGTLQENTDYAVSAVFTGVDQNVPFSAMSTFTSLTTSTPVSLSPALATTAGGLAVAAIHCGNATTPAGAIGSSNTYAINSSFTEVIDTYTAQSGFAGSGMCVQVSNKPITIAGTEAPAFTFAGTPNRQAIIAFNMQCLRELDNSVRLIKGGTITGNNLAQTTTPWLTTESYVSYGGSSNLWGTTWNPAQINSANFGAVLSAITSNGTARVDHIRITVTGTSTLPVDLLDFYGTAEESRNCLKWQTANERNNKHFIVERGDAAGNFVPLGTIAGKASPAVLNNYNFTDEDPLTGNNYYRLKQVDEDGEYKYSKIIVMTHLPEMKGVTLYPNPSPDGHFTLASDLPLTNSVSIYSSDMKLIKAIENNSQILDVSLTELTDGIYYLVYTAGGAQKIKQLQKFCK